MVKKTPKKQQQPKLHKTDVDCPAMWRLCVHETSEISMQPSEAGCYLNTPTLIDSATSGFRILVFFSGPTQSACPLDKRNSKKVFQYNVKQSKLRSFKWSSHDCHIESHPFLCCSACSLILCWPCSSSRVTKSLLLSIKRFWGKKKILEKLKTLNI